MGWLAIGWILVPTLSYAQNEVKNQNPSVYKIRETDREISIDGSLDESVWRHAVSVPLDVQRFPNPNATAPVETRIYITYDRNHLYVGFEASDPRPPTIKAHLMDRDEQEKLNRDDYVGFTIDPFNTGQWGYQFKINPLGVQADAIYSDQRNSTDYSWNTIWKSEGTITDEGYVVEVRIPLSSINIPSKNLQNWRFSAFRNYPREVKYRIRSHPVDLNEQSLMSQFDRLTGFKNLSSGLNLQITPTLTAKRTDQVGSGSADHLETGSIGFDPGANVQWRVKPNVNLSATVNPDFSQVEADALRLRENRRFVLSFPEKRPFFLESAEIFETPLNAVFTRSIIEPEGGLKLTGKSGPHSYGTFVTRDQSSSLVFPSNQRSEGKILNSPTYSEILRYRGKISDHMAVGVLAEGRQGVHNEYRNHAGGMDGYVDFWDSNRLRFQYLHSSTHYPGSLSETYDQPTSSFTGGALRTVFNHDSRNWSAAAEFTSISSGFRNDNGFFQRADFRKYRASGKRIFRGSSNSWFSSLQFGPTAELITDQSGQLTDRSLSLTATYTGPMQSEVYTEYTHHKQRFAGRLFTGMQTGVLFFRFRPSNLFTKFRLYISYGDAIDYTNLRRANELIVHPGLTVDVSRNLNIELDPNFQSLSHHGVNTFNTYLLGTRVIYHFNKRTFLRSILQYRYVDRNLDRYVSPDRFANSTESMYYQLLFSYKLNPRSKLFLGYSSGYEGINDRMLDIQSRTGFFKAGYAWRF